jgi:uncharacterized protein YndB with AHSA1/START domain
MVRFLLYAVGALVALALLVVVVGLVLPAQHVVARRLVLAAPPDRAWTLLTSPDSFPAWRRDLQRVEPLAPDAEGHARWRETSRMGTIPFRVMASTPPTATTPGRRVTRIDDPALPFGGDWELVVAPAGGGGSTVTITERGEVRNPVFRALSRFVFGHASTMEAVLRDLAAHLGETGAPAPVAATP